MSGQNLTQGLSRYQYFVAPRDTAKDEERGKLDGQRNFPPDAQNEFTSYEVEIVFEGKGDIANYCQKIQTDTYQHNTNIARLEKYLYQDMGSKKDDLMIMRDMDIATAKSKGESSSKERRLRDSDFDAEREYEDIKFEEGGRELDVHMHNRLFPKIPLSQYAFVMLALAAVELIINRQAFDTMFGTSSLQAYGGAIIVGAVIITLSHLIGLFFRQWKTRQKKPNWVRIVAGGTLVFMALSLITRLSIARNTSSQGPSFNNGGQAAATNSSDLLWPSDASLNDVSWLLFVVNLGVFLVGLWASYVRHDPNPDYERVYNNHVKARAELEALRREFADNVKEVEESFRLKLNSITNRQDRIKREIIEEKEKIKQIESQIKSEEQKIISNVVRRISAYQTANREHRTTGGEPEYFGKDTEKRVREIIDA